MGSSRVLQARILAHMLPVERGSINCRSTGRGGSRSNNGGSECPGGLFEFEDVNASGRGGVGVGIKGQYVRKEWPELDLVVTVVARSRLWPALQLKACQIHCPETESFSCRTVGERPETTANIRGQTKRRQVPTHFRSAPCRHY